MYKTESEWLCLDCWQILQDFDGFYKRIENAHIRLKELMKSEAEPPTSNEYFSVNLLEPEIVLEQTEVTVKQEYKDSETENEDDIPLIHMRPSVKISLGESINESTQHCAEDPLIKTEKPKRNIKRKTLLDSTNTKTSTKNCVPENDIECKVEPELDISQTSNDISDSPPLITSNSTNTPLQYYYQSKMNISEYDSFIAQHFKLICNKCQSTAKTFEELQRHFEEIHKRKQAYVICCGTKFRDVCFLVDHINLHLNPEYFKCEHCPQVLTLRKTYINHMHSHDKIYACEICDKKFASKHLVNIHKLTHLPEDEKKFPCDTCEKW